MPPWFVQSSSQIASALREKTQNYSRHRGCGQGYGLIDVSALPAAFD
ncbi:MAG: hypothetical protein AVDCRST_MAG56-7667 [uncultured Cytophagales bacterium]|uniref:Uncharacterized protein n=1 Tax=uncultured Cytophagales bacterium TaxID=158755 RepID=A0A6J4LM05_9SPHI|nr:MAG: hypothetical protein AVDCRST_MAG56-7667 [uncultured Cytophagales bacterium]